MKGIVSDLKTNVTSKRTEKRFNGFSRETGDFFWELVFNNNRTWFQENKDRFEELLNTPFKVLAEETTDLVTERYPLSGLECHASRIYRDARRLYGRGPFKESMWFSIKDRSNGYDGPSFFFEITPKSWCYGMGFYCPKAEMMEKFRKSIDAEPERFRTLAEQILSYREFRLEGEDYRRPKGEYREPIGSWYNKKWFSLVCNCDFEGELFSPGLPEILANEFAKLMPMYEYLVRFCAQ